ncbi:MAG: YbfB/YjiJ family MFS transporter [Gammaproteobacteria bacterium]|nr:YbfB/YjiJ family MFS transporter [Gammaproteobacteria bacterium]
MSDPLLRLKVLSAGILSLVLTLGIARFAYTPLLPLMQQQAGLGVADGGWLASINYLGYLGGAILASLFNDLVIKDRLYRVGLLIAIVSTAGMALTTDFWVWSMWRFVAGLSSAAGLLLGSGLILNWLIRHDYRSELGIHFAGIGLGILVCAAAVEIMASWLDWYQQWWVFTLLGMLLLIPAWAWLPAPDRSSYTRSGNPMRDRPPTARFMRLFILAYFCAGVGYVISATFIVAIVERLPGLEGKGNWSFMLLGLAATPACIIWDLVARRIGELNALLAASMLQIIGIGLPLLSNNLLLTLLSAILFGGTFIGIVSLVLTMAGRYYPTRPAKMMGKMTISYGIAQITAPALTGLIAGYTGNYNNGLYLAAGMMVIGTLLLMRLKVLESAKKSP